MLCGVCADNPYSRRPYSGATENYPLIASRIVAWLKNDRPRYAGGPLDVSIRLAEWQLRPLSLVMFS